VADWDTDLANFTFGQDVIGVVAGLRWQIESNRKTGLALGQVLAVKRVGIRGRRVAGIGAENPRLIALGFVAHRWPNGDILA
jgi:hypothetical protein